MMGVFVALDLFLFYVFFEVMLMPMYFLIGIWGGPRREYAAIKFFIYTLLGSVLILLVILGLYFSAKVTDPATGVTMHTFNMLALTDSEQTISSDLKENARKDNTDGCRRFDMRIGKPGMKRKHEYLNRKADEQRNESYGSPVGSNSRKQ